MLSAPHRLRSNHEFQQVYRRGRSWAHPLLILHVLDQPSGKRLGVSTSKKVGKAHVRNHVRRRVREIVRVRLSEWQEGFSAVVVTRPAAAEASFAELEAALVELARRARLPREPSAPADSLYHLPSRNPRSAPACGRKSEVGRAGTGEPQREEKSS